MKKRYIMVGLLSAFLSARAQHHEGSYVKQRLASKEVSLLMSFYTQDNDHSAVTGGIGTEDLQVYATDISMNWKKDSVSVLHIDGGVDIISSASTDNIDFEVSSASKTDARSHIGIAYDHVLPNNFWGGVNGTFSIESDYTSGNLGFNVSRVSEDLSREWSVNVQTFFDDLRWGRFENGHPQKLVYPVELRTKNWYDQHNRYSYNVDFSFVQTINKRTNLALFPGIVLQRGLLATPFHRVYFLDDSKRVEKFPNTRWKIPVGIQLNTFIGYKTILRTNYRYYWDDFGIIAHTLTVEVPYKISNIWTLLPSIRYYTQSSADFFQPYSKHALSESFYTSDYDLSRFQSVKAGMGFRYAPFAAGRIRTFEEIEMRYSYYKRSDGLVSHMVSFYFAYSKQRGFR